MVRRGQGGRQVDLVAAEVVVQAADVAAAAAPKTARRGA